jgi:hypothetical protein
MNTFTSNVIFSYQFKICKETDVKTVHSDLTEIRSSSFREGREFIIFSLHQSVEVMGIFLLLIFPLLLRRNLGAYCKALTPTPLSRARGGGVELLLCR